jgi:glycosyltransferase involved in cell wall biosynthesis
MVRVSVVLPCRNEEKTIGICIGKIKRVFEERGIDGEIIVSDSSSDRSGEIAEGLGAKVVRHNKNGYGNAYLEALGEAGGDFVIIGDADNTYDFLEIPKLLDKMESCDFVIGSRMRGDIKRGAMKSLHRYVGNPALNLMFNIFYGTDLSDTHSGFRGIRREALERLNLSCTGMEFALEMITEAKKNGLVISEVPITYYPRGGVSKLNSFRDGWRHVRFIIGKL